MEDKYASTLHPLVDYAAGIFLLIVALLTVVGNVAVLATAVKCSPYLKSPDLLSINLAVTDLGMALSMYPLAIASAWNHAWIGGDPTCLYYALMGFFFGVASMMTLTAMAVIRYLMAVLVSLGFLVSWTPYAIVSFWSIFHSSASIPPIVSLLPCLFAKSSTAFNPIIYYMFSKIFRQKVKQLKCCCGWRIHFLQQDNSGENPAVSVIWSGRENIQLSSVLKFNKGQTSSTITQ
ncbi:hypothetical protein GDO78_017795 [Eleutherodactylus coqui]|uniref:G-protein coupled receptors family 1 profile domain-containing protein n=1 Tax=Eleutherodactylus coqui TaxID=57060 RepID=A0A8J6B9P9_ELECQ|nr:hypothetical protein GDO78_017795 [Eleutherodactylus coqui]